MISISKEANPNYLCKVFKIESLKKHSNADKLQICEVDFQPVITGLNTKIGDIYVYFPEECKINKDFLRFTNSFRDSEMNLDKSKKGFFESNCRVRSMKLRGENSCGYIVPIEHLEDFTGFKDFDKCIDNYFDTINDIKIIEKYTPKSSQPSVKESKKTNKKSIKKISRLIKNQFHLHNDTENLRKNIWKLKPSDYIGIHYKKHGSSWVVSNCLVKKPLKWYEKILKKVGINIIDTEYDYVYSSRKVVKNEFETKNNNHYYGVDIWGEIKETLKDLIPKGWTLYGEVLGFTKTGAPIQEDYDYGCEENKYKIYVYRITITNLDGVVIELDDNQIKEFCDRNNLNYSDTFFYYGQAQNLYPELDTEEHWHENFIKNLERDYNEKDCFMCKNVVPEEGIVLRIMKLFNYDAYKLKSFRFRKNETEKLDKGGVIDMETLESEN